MHRKCHTICNGMKDDISSDQVFELLTASCLFNPRPLEHFTAQHYHLARIFGTLVSDAEYERVREFLQSGRNYDKLFHEDGGMRDLLEFIPY